MMAPISPTLSPDTLSFIQEQPSIVDALGAAVVGVDRHERVIVWNRAAERLFGWSRDEVLGRVPPIVPAQLRQEWRLQMQQILDGGCETVTAETQRITRDRRTVPVMRTSSPLHDEDRNVIGVLDTLVDIAEHQRMDYEARALAQLRERETIAMDLHDGFVQDLYGVALVLASTEQGDPSGGAAVNALRQARADIDSIIDETRRYLMDLRARELLPRNLAAGLRLLVDTLRINAKVEAELQLDPAADARLEPEARGHLLYIAREAVSNVLRHAQASSVLVALSLDGDRVLLAVTDDGRGFDPSESTDKKRRHYGLRNMRTRARMIGAHLAVASRPEHGARVMLELPLAG